MTPFADLKPWDIFVFDNRLFQKRDDVYAEKVSTGAIVKFCPTERVQKARSMRPLRRSIPVVARGDHE